MQHQLNLGDHEFVLKHRAGLIDSNMKAVAKAQRRTAALSLAEYRQLYPDRNEAIARAYWSTAFTMAEIGAFFAVGYSTVRREVQGHASNTAGWRLSGGGLN